MQFDGAGFASWLKEQELADNTVDCYIRAVKGYSKLFDTICKDNMIAYKQYLIENFSPQTAANRCIGMGRYCDYIQQNQCKVKAVKLPKRTSADNVISEKEYKYLLDCLAKDKDFKTFWLVSFMAKTGARVSEIRRLEKKHLKSGEARLWTKGKIRRIIIPAQLIKDSEHYFSEVKSKFLFPSQTQGSFKDGEYKNMMTTRGIAWRLVQAGKKYGVRAEVMHPHSFRHYFAIQFLKRSNDLVLLADLLGHESVNTTAIYLQLSAKEQREKVQSIVDW